MLQSYACRRGIYSALKSLGHKSNTRCQGSSTHPQLTDYSSLITSPEVDENIQRILRHYQGWREESRKFPDMITTEDMQKLLNMEYWDRRTYLRKKWKLERTILELDRRDVVRNREPVPEDVTNRIFDPEMLKESLENFYVSRLCTAATFGHSLIFDMSYDAIMDKSECLVAIQQLEKVYCDNKWHREPFRMHFCNVAPTGQTNEYMRTFLPHLYDAKSVVQVESASYLDLFPRDKLVYLSPNARECLTTYDHDAIYVIGVLVELSERKPASVQKAEREGIRMAKLPLEKYFRQSYEERCLRMRQVVNILLEIKETGDWQTVIDQVLDNQSLLDI